MKTDHNIFEKVGHQTGYTVPDNYFDSVRSKIMQNLPEYQEAKPEKLSAWKKVQPYLYMAAMFAGIWCMMKMFHMITTPDLSLDNPPEAIALAMADIDNADLYAPAANDEVYLIEEDICTQYSDFEDFKEDFNSTEL